MVNNAQAEAKIDQILKRYSSGPIKHYPYEAGAVDRYRQRASSFETGVMIVGRAILNPTEEQIMGIGEGREYDIAFLFSRLEQIRKFPSQGEGQWIDTKGQMEWRNDRYKIDKVHPTGQIEDTFLMTVVLGSSIKGERGDL